MFLYFQVSKVLKVQTIISRVHPFMLTVCPWRECCLDAWHLILWSTWKWVMILKYICRKVGSVYPSISRVYTWSEKYGNLYILLRDKAGFWKHCIFLWTVYMFIYLFPKKEIYIAVYNAVYTPAYIWSEGTSWNCPRIYPWIPVRKQTLPDCPRFCGGKYCLYNPQWDRQTDCLLLTQTYQPVQSRQKQPRDLNTSQGSK